MTTLDPRLRVRCPTCGAAPYRMCASISTFELASPSRVAKRSGTELGYQREPHASRAEAAGRAS